MTHFVDRFEKGGHRGTGVNRVNDRKGTGVRLERL